MIASCLLSLLLSNAVTLRRDKAILYSRTGICILVYVLIIGSDSLNLVSVGGGLGLYGGLFHATTVTLIFQNFMYLLSAIILLLTGFFPRKIITSADYKSLGLKFSNIVNKKAEHFKIIEYPLLLLFILTGATFLISSNDIVSIFISIELQSYGLYLLAASYRNSELSTSAGLTYFLLGGLSSCFILLGTALLYANSGITSLELFYIINNIWDISKDSVMFSFESNYINYALIVMVVGFLFKISAAPFHFWSPDVYDAIPTIVTTFVAIIAKISILIFLFEIVHYTSSSVFNYSVDWRYTLLLSSLLSLIVGTVLGLNQFRIKRLYAYSTISHLGFILLALSINTVESIQAFMFYLIQYSISNLNAFIILISIGFSLYLYTSETHSTELLDKNNSPIQLISQLKGYFQFNPMIAISLVITIYSFVGIPPLLGFFAKQMVLSAALDNGFVFLSLIAILTSVISAVYYLNVVKQIFFDKFTYTLNNEFKEINIKSTDVKLSGAFSISISILTLLLISYIFFSNSTRLLAILLFNI